MTLRCTSCFIGLELLRHAGCIHGTNSCIQWCRQSKTRQCNRFDASCSDAHAAALHELARASAEWCEARSSGQYTVDKKSSSVCPTAGVQQRLHGRATSVQYSKNKMSETDVAQGQSAMPHILRCFDNGCPKKVVNPNGPGRNWPRQCIMEIAKFLNSCNFMPWHPALT